MPNGWTERAGGRRGGWKRGTEGEGEGEVEKVEREKERDGGMEREKVPKPSINHVDVQLKYT